VVAARGGAGSWPDGEVPRRGGARTGRCPDGAVRDVGDQHGAGVFEARERRTKGRTEGGIEKGETSSYLMP